MRPVGPGRTPTGKLPGKPGKPGKPEGKHKGTQGPAPAGKIGGRPGIDRPPPQAEIPPELAAEAAKLSEPFFSKPGASRVPPDDLVDEVAKKVEAWLETQGKKVDGKALRDGIKDGLTGLSTAYADRVPTAEELQREAANGLGMLVQMLLNPNILAV